MAGGKNREARRKNRGASEKESGVSGNDDSEGSGKDEEESEKERRSCGKVSGGCEKESAATWASLGVFNCPKCHVIMTDQNLFRHHICRSRGQTVRHSIAPAVTANTLKTASTSRTATVQCSASMTVQALNTETLQSSATMAAHALNTETLQSSASGTAYDVSAASTHLSRALTLHSSQTTNVNLSKTPVNVCLPSGSSVNMVSPTAAHSPQTWTVIRPPRFATSVHPPKASPVNLNAMPADPSYAETALGFTQFDRRKNFFPKHSITSNGTPVNLASIVYNGRNQLYECSICTIGLKRQEFADHLQCHLFINPFRCFTCNKDFPTMLETQKHCLDSHEVGPVLCQLKQNPNVSTFLEKVRVSGSALYRVVNSNVVKTNIPRNTSLSVPESVDTLVTARFRATASDTPISMLEAVSSRPFPHLVPTSQVPSSNTSISSGANEESCDQQLPQENGQNNTASVHSGSQPSPIPSQRVSQGGLNMPLLQHFLPQSLLPTQAERTESSSVVQPPSTLPAGDSALFESTAHMSSGYTKRNPSPSTSAQPLPEEIENGLMVRRGFYICIACMLKWKMLVPFLDHIWTQHIHRLKVCQCTDDAMPDHKPCAQFRDTVNRVFKRSCLAVAEVLMRYLKGQASRKELEALEAEGAVSKLVKKEFTEEENTNNEETVSQDRNVETCESASVSAEMSHMSLGSSFDVTARDNTHIPLAEPQVGVDHCEENDGQPAETDQAERNGTSCRKAVCITDERLENSVTRLTQLVNSDDLNIGSGSDTSKTTPTNSEISDAQEISIVDKNVMPLCSTLAAKPRESENKETDTVADVLSDDRTILSNSEILESEQGASVSSMDTHGKPEVWSNFYKCTVQGCSFSCCAPLDFLLHSTGNAHKYESRFTCCYCGETEEVLTMLIRHLEGHIGSFEQNEFKFSCTVSLNEQSEVLSDKKVPNLLRQLNMRCVEAEKQNTCLAIKCNNCDQTFHSYSEINNHFDDSLILPVHECRYCRGYFVDGVACYEHVKLEHPNQRRQIRISSKLLCSRSKENSEAFHRFKAMKKLSRSMRRQSSSVQQESSVSSPVAELTSASYPQNAPEEMETSAVVGGEEINSENVSAVLTDKTQTETFQGSQRDSVNEESQLRDKSGIDPKAVNNKTLPEHSIEEEPTELHSQTDTIKAGKGPFNNGDSEASIITSISTEVQSKVVAMALDSGRNDVTVDVMDTDSHPSQSAVIQGHEDNKGTKLKSRDNHIISSTQSEEEVAKAGTEFQSEKKGISSSTLRAQYDNSFAEAGRASSSEAEIATCDTKVTSGMLQLIKEPEVCEPSKNSFSSKLDAGNEISNSDSQRNHDDTDEPLCMLSSDETCSANRDCEPCRSNVGKEGRSLSKNGKLEPLSSDGCVFLHDSNSYDKFETGSISSNALQFDSTSQYSSDNLQSESSSIRKLQSESTSNDGLQSESTSNDEMQSESTSNDPLQSESTSNDELQSESTSIDKLQSEPTSNDELQSESTSNDQLQSESTSNDELQSESTSNDELQSESTSNDELQSESTSNDELQSESVSNYKMQSESTSIDKLQSESTVSNKLQSEPTISNKLQSEAATSDKLQSEPTISDKLQSEPTTSDKLQSVPTISDKLQSEAATSDKLQSEPTISDKLQSEPTISDKLQSEPTISDKLQSEPTVSNKLQSEPTISNKLQSEAATSNKLQSEPTISDKLQSGPTISNKLQSEPTISDKLQSGPTISNKLQSEPTISDKLHSEPTVKDKLQSEATSENKLQSEATINDRLQSEPTISDKLHSEPTVKDKLQSEATFKIKLQSEATTSDKVQSEPTIIDKLSEATSKNKLQTESTSSDKPHSEVIPLIQISNSSKNSGITDDRNHQFEGFHGSELKNKNSSCLNSKHLKSPGSVTMYAGHQKRFYDICGSEELDRYLNILYTGNQDSKYICKKCSKRFSSIKVTHCHIFHCQGGLGIVKCPHCLRQFSHPKLVTDHVNQNHPTKDKEKKLFSTVDLNKVLNALENNEIKSDTFASVCKTFMEPELSRCTTTGSGRDRSNKIKEAHENSESIRKATMQPGHHKSSHFKSEAAGTSNSEDVVDTESVTRIVETQIAKTSTRTVPSISIESRKDTHGLSAEENISDEAPNAASMETPMKVPAESSDHSKKKKVLKGTSRKKNLSTTEETTQNNVNTPSGKTPNTLTANFTKPHNKRHLSVSPDSERYGKISKHVDPSDQSLKKQPHSSAKEQDTIFSDDNMVAFLCSVCQYQTHSRTDIYNHTKIKHPGIKCKIKRLKAPQHSEIYKCRICSWISEWDQTLMEEHIGKEHGNFVSCGYCGFVYDLGSRNKLLNHLKFAHKDKKDEKIGFLTPHSVFRLFDDKVTLLSKFPEMSKAKNKESSTFTQTVTKNFETKKSLMEVRSCSGSVSKLVSTDVTIDLTESDNEEDHACAQECLKSFSDLTKTERGDNADTILDLTSESSKEDEIQDKPQQMNSVDQNMESSITIDLTNSDQDDIITSDQYDLPCPAEEKQKPSSFSVKEKKTGCALETEQSLPLASEQPMTKTTNMGHKKDKTIGTLEPLVSDDPPQSSSSVDEFESRKELNETSVSNLATTEGMHTSTNSVTTLNISKEIQAEQMETEAQELEVLKSKPRESHVMPNVLEELNSDETSSTKVLQPNSAASISTEESLVRKNSAFNVSASLEPSDFKIRLQNEAHEIVFPKKEPNEEPLSGTKSAQIHKTPSLANTKSANGPVSQSLSATQTAAKENEGSVHSRIKVTPSSKKAVKTNKVKTVMDMKDYPLRCAVCQSCMKSLEDLKMHFKWLHTRDPIRFIDRVSEFVYSDDGQLLQAQCNQKQTDSPYLCQLCPFRSQQRSVVKAHAAECHDRVSILYLQDLSESSAQILQPEERHRPKPTSTAPGWVSVEPSKGRPKTRQFKTGGITPTRFICHLCPEVLSSEFLFKLHLAKHEVFTYTSELVPDSGILLCPLCMYVAKSRSDLADHTGKHLNERRYFCTLCPDIDDHKKKSVVRHIERFHPYDNRAKLGDREKLKKTKLKVVDLTPTVPIEDIFQASSEWLKEHLLNYGVSNIDVLVDDSFKFSSHHGDVFDIKSV